MIWKRWIKGHFDENVRKDQITFLGVQYPKEDVVEVVADIGKRTVIMLRCSDPQEAIDYKQTLLNELNG